MSEVLRIRHVPAAHAYVEHLLPVGGTAAQPGGGQGDGTAGGERAAYPQVVHLPDPPVPGAPPGQWWPHPALEAAWVREHAAEQDVLHVHFGTEGRTLPELEAWLGALRVAGPPLVLTVHDIDHPHLADQEPYRAQLALLVPAAEGLLTLTEGAAAVVEREFGRRPLVVPHPHVAPLELVGRRAGAWRSGGGLDGAAGGSGGGPGPLRVGVHLKGLRTNLAPMRVLPSLMEAVAELRAAGEDVELEVRAHPEALAEGVPGRDELRGWWRSVEADGAGGVSLVVAPRLEDDELWDYLGGRHVSVLPYAWGTHSGWVEACRDLGTWVLAPDVGHLVEQGAGSVLAWGDAGSPPEVEVLVSLLRQALAGPPPRVSAEGRSAQRERIAELHARVYGLVAEGRRVDAGGRTEE